MRFYEKQYRELIVEARNGEYAVELRRVTMGKNFNYRRMR